MYYARVPGMMCAMSEIHAAFIHFSNLSKVNIRPIIPGDQNQADIKMGFSIEVYHKSVFHTCREKL